MMNDSGSRRRRLAALAKAMGGIALVAVGFVLYQAAPPQAPGASHVTRYHLGSVARDPLARLDWNGRPLLLARRTPETIAALRKANPALRDPASNDSEQPPEARNPYRSLRPELFIALAVGTGSGCILEPLPASASPGPLPWHGGYRDHCDGSLYDPAGRVYTGSPARLNLPVPRHRIEGEYLLLEN